MSSSAGNRTVCRSSPSSAGVVQFRDFVENVSMKIEVDQITSFKRIVILDYREDLHPQILIKEPKTNNVLGNYSIPSGAYVLCREGQGSERRHGARQDAAQGSQDQGYYRRSAAGGRALRGAAAQGCGGNFEDRRHRRFWRHSARNAAVDCARHHYGRRRGTH